MLCISFFFFNDTATTEIYTLSLHDALPILHVGRFRRCPRRVARLVADLVGDRAENAAAEDRKSTRLNSSHLVISYAVFCLKKKLNPHQPRYLPIVRALDHDRNLRAVLPPMS